MLVLKGRQVFVDDELNLLKEFHGSVERETKGKEEDDVTVQPPTDNITGANRRSIWDQIFEFVEGIIPLSSIDSIKVHFWVG